MDAKRVILDVDVGTDDYLAILLFLNAEKCGQIQIDGIICSMGNTTVDNVCRNVVRLLETAGRTDIPVYKGASKQLIPPKHHIQMFHGPDGFGGVLNNDNINMDVIGKKPGAVAMHDIVVNNSKEITLICLAALTNVALAIKMYDDFVLNIKEVWIMGGNYTAVGNITACAEYNFYIDPEAAYIILDSLTCPIYILTWETCLFLNISFDWRYNIFGNTQDPLISLLNLAEKAIYDENYEKENTWMPCDAFLAAAFLHPAKMIVKTSEHHASVELHGSQTRGQIVLDHLKRNKPNVTIIEQIHEDAFKELLLKL